jgi:hypothetical protein
VNYAVNKWLIFESWQSINNPKTLYDLLIEETFLSNEIEEAAKGTLFSQLDKT